MKPDSATPETTITPAERRRERNRRLMRQEILDAARAIIADEGIESLSMRALAARVGMSAPTVYDYFESKDGVLNGLFTDAVLHFATAFDQALEGANSSKERLIEMALAYYDVGMDSPDLFRMVMCRVDAAYHPGPEQLDQVHGLYEQLETEVAAALGETDRSLPAVQQWVLLIWMVTHGFTSLALDGHLKNPDLGDKRPVLRHQLELALAGFPVVARSE